MKIAIDAHMLGHQETGNETYVRELIKAFAGNPGENQYFVLVEDHKRLPAEVLQACNIEVIKLSTVSAVRRLVFELPPLVESYRFDVLHVTYNAPFRCSCPLVVTVHDISFERHPRWFSTRDRLLLSNMVPRSVRKARKVITGTATSKAEMVQAYNLAPQKVVVTPYGVDSRFKPVEDKTLLNNLREKYQTSEKFILGLGNLQPRKNFHLLAEAFALAKSRHGLDAKLVIAGQSAGQSQALFALVEKLGIGNSVVFTGYVPEEDLPTLYSAASLFVFPSLEEGFGFPVLEAMACGTPVITSDIPCLREIVADSSLLFDPASPAQLAHLMVETLENEPTRQELRQKGLNRSLKFSWEETARQTNEAYKLAAGMKAGREEFLPG